MKKTNEMSLYRRPLSKRSIFLSFAISAAYLFLLYTIFSPRWETNDDVGMSMAAHGYGLAAFGTPKIIFSNVIWGYIVRAIPPFNGILGYSIATIFTLVFCGAIFFYGLSFFGAGNIFSFLLFVILISRPALFPQFTINSGFLAIAALICFHMYIHTRNIFYIFLWIFFSSISFLVRHQQYLLVTALSLPLIPFRLLIHDKTIKYSVLFFIFLITIFLLFDKSAYNDKSWEDFDKLNSVRAKITDFGADKYLSNRQDILVKNGYSANDIFLLKNWFFVDRNIADSEKLHAILQELGPLPLQRGSLDNAFVGLKTLLNPILLPILLFSLLSLFLYWNYRVVAVWVLCLLSLFLIGLFGRPGILRVYVPLTALLAISPFITESYFYKKDTRKKDTILKLVLLCSIFFVLFKSFSDSKNYEKKAIEIRDGLTRFPKHPVIVWGAMFPFESVYPVLNTNNFSNYNLYGLGVFTLAPFSVAYNEQKNGKGMNDLLKNGKEVSLIASKNSVSLLSTYCKEHLMSDIKHISTEQHGAIRIETYTCSSPFSVLR